MTLPDKIKRTIQAESLIEPGDRVLLGLSGGIDSTTMLYLLHDAGRTFPFGLGVAHINHLLRGEESERDEEFVRSLAGSLSLPCHVLRIDVRGEAKKAGKSLQHAGRDVRYRFFSDTAAEHGYRKIGIAHTLDDQVETFILRMLKGTGLRGLSAIPIKRDNIIRPLLTVARSEIEEYARALEFSFVEDSSNKKIVYERNFVRRQLVPWMEKLNPNFRERIFSLLKDLTVVNRTFDESAANFVESECIEDGEAILLGVEAAMGLDEETRFRVMAGLLGRLEPGFIPLREHMRQIDNVLSSLRPNLAVTLPHGFRVKKEYGKLVLTREPPRLPPMEVIPVGEGMNRLEPFNLSLGLERLPGEGRESIFSTGPATAFFDADKLGVLRVRSFREGDRFVPLGMKESVKLKDFFISRKIPREERRHVPLLLSGDDILWVVGHRIDNRFKTTGETRHIMKAHAATLL